jgi:trk system potassium uptake protein TrkH
LNARTVSHLLGILVLALGLSMFITLGWASYFGERDARSATLLSMAICLGLGLVLVVAGRGYSADQILRREGLGVVALGWGLAAVLGGLPYLFSGALTHPVDAFFESMSGFTTTGSTVLRDIEAVPKSILFWRDFTQWLGGIGIIVLFIAILPQMGVGARHMFRSEIPGTDKEGMSPRIKDTAVTLLWIYITLTVVEMLVLRGFGMTYFDASCHALGTMATGGFSPRNGSIADYPSLAIHITIMVFMFLAGTNFGLFFFVVRGRVKTLFKDPEWRVYVGILAVTTAVLGWDLYRSSAIVPAGAALRHALFQTLSINTTTGFVTWDFDQWSPFAKFMLVCLMFIGGSAGSTAGGMKVMRVLVLVKLAYQAIYHWFRPHAIITPRVGGRPVRDETSRDVLGYFVLFMLLFVAGSLAMTMLGLDMVSATTGVLTALANVGPGLGALGAVESFADVPVLGKLLLSFYMLLGRLEIFTVMVLVVPAFWRR